MYLPRPYLALKSLIKVVGGGAGKISRKFPWVGKGHNLKLRNGFIATALVFKDLAKVWE